MTRKQSEILVALV